MNAELHSIIALLEEVKKEERQSSLSEFLSNIDTASGQHLQFGMAKASVLDAARNVSPRYRLPERSRVDVYGACTCGQATSEELCIKLHREAFLQKFLVEVPESLQGNTLPLKLAGDKYVPYSLKPKSLCDHC